VGVGDRFQSETKYRRGELPRGGLDWANKPPVYKRYPSATRVSLNAPQRAGGTPTWDALQQRRSVRQFQEAPLTNAELSQLLWAAQGVTRFNRDVGFRTAPSAGALYPVETYLALHAVEGIEPGLYHYVVEEHELEQLRTGDLRQAVAQAALDQPIAARAGVVFIWTAIFKRSKWKYRQRAYRYVYLDAGHIAQNVALGAVALGLGSCQIAAFYDEETNTLLGVDGQDESAIYMTAVGKC
jgi:SagB-type dehydrogenase family enzyme